MSFKIMFISLLALLLLGGLSLALPRLSPIFASETLQLEPIASGELLEQKEILE